MRANARHFFSAINSPLLILPAVLPRARGEEQEKEEEKRKRRREKKRIGLRVIFKMGGGTNDGDLEEEEEEDWDEQDWARYQVIRDWRPPPPPPFISPQVRDAHAGSQNTRINMESVVNFSKV